MKSKNRFTTSCGVLAIGLFYGAQAHAIPVTASFTDSTLFDQLIHSTSHWKNQQTLGFDSIPSGAIIPTGGTVFGSDGTGVRFDYDIAGLDMMVASGFDTTSGNHYLGLNDPGNFDQFVAGDMFNLSFTKPINALGMFFISGDPLLGGDVQLVTALGTVENSATAEYQLADGGYAYFLGFASLISEFTFANAGIRFKPDAAGAFLFNIDDIETARVPEPHTYLLFGAGFLLLMLQTARREKSHS